MELVIKAGDGDSFLKSVLPPDGLRMPMDFGLSWSPSTGVVMRGGATLEIDLPIDLDLVFLRIPVVSLSLGFRLPAGQPPEVALGVGATIELEIGPVYASIEKMGLALVATFPPKGGNLGPVDLGLRFLPPKGMALSVDAGPVSGGGYLMADYDKGEYAGILHLAIADTIEITAIGLLQTKMPDGSEGFSLVVLISAEFPAIQIGYGFYLKGVGGLVGINRSLNVPALQDGLRRGAVGSLLFPTDPIPRARQIIADVGAIFPPTEGQFVLGPMIKFGWGAEMVSVTLAVIIQVPALKIALLGRLQLMLPPVEEAAVILLRLDFAGILDLPAKTISFDGSLDGSRIAVFSLTGDIAMRLNFGDQPGLRVLGRRAAPDLSRAARLPRPAAAGAVAGQQRQPAAADGGLLRRHARHAAVRRPRRALLRRRHRDRRQARDRRGGEPRRADHVPLDVRGRPRHARAAAPQRRAVHRRRARPADQGRAAARHRRQRHAALPAASTRSRSTRRSAARARSRRSSPCRSAERVRTALGDERSWSAKAPAGATGVRADRAARGRRAAARAPARVAGGAPDRRAARRRAREGGRGADRGRRARSC